MNTVVVIPTYWGRESHVGWKEGDAIYDHPTPLDKEGTLARAIDSIKILNDKDFTLVVIAAATAEDIEKKVEEKVSSILKGMNPGVDVVFFSHSHLERIKAELKKKGKEDLVDVLSLRGYSNIRNLCLFVPHLLGAEEVVLIDDDEVFEDPDFIKKAREFIGTEFKGEKILAVAGYYIQPDGGYLLHKDFEPWMVYWNNLEKMNEAFEKFIGKGERLKETPFVFGGNAIIHRDLFVKIPFDPGITRGEDIDYLINARMFGIKFYLDNQLFIRHLPPPKPYPTWMKMRVDIYRFVYEREKLRTQEPIKGMRKVTVEELDPYPGVFLRDDLEEKVYRASELLAIQYMAEGKPEDALESLKNIEIAKIQARPLHNPFRSYLSFQQKWESLMTLGSGLHI